MAGRIRPDHLQRAATSYIIRRAKRLRPSILLLAAGCFGGPGAEQAAFPAAVGVELFHTWTLVHDDIIDHDAQRRGGPTVQKLIQDVALREKEITDSAQAEDYAHSVAILTGDIQHGWAVDMFVEVVRRAPDVDPKVILQIIGYLEGVVLPHLIGGETLDVQFGLMPLGQLFGLSEREIVDMLWMKTGALYEFAGMAGVMIGKNTDDINDAHVQRMKRFAGNCGIAFQLQDDILGIVGDEKTLASGGLRYPRGKKDHHTARGAEKREQGAAGIHDLGSGKQGCNKRRDRAGRRAVPIAGRYRVYGKSGQIVHP